MIPGLDTPVKVMSGGNLQRLLLAREISQNPKVLIASYPVRGLDVARTEAVYNLLWEERNKGTAILLVMEDIEEIMRVADRVPSCITDGCPGAYQPMMLIWKN
jgi:simple sugar transport system ATP-binding protein